MNYENFRQEIGREFAAWKQQQGQQSGGVLQNADELEMGTILRGRNNHEMKFRNIDGEGRIRYYWKTEDGNWSARARTMAPASFRNMQYKKQEAPGSTDGPRAQVGERVGSPERLRIGDIIQSREGQPRRRILGLPREGTRMSFQELDDNGNDIGGVREISFAPFREHKVVEHASEQQQQDEPPSRLHSFPVSSGRGLEPGTVLQGRLGLNGPESKVKIKSVDDHGSIQYHWQKEDGSWSNRTRTLTPGTMTYGQFRVFGPRPRVEIGGEIKDTQRLRPGDYVANAHLKSENKARKILEVLPDGQVKTQMVNTSTGRNLGDRSTLPADQLLSRGDYNHLGRYSRVEDAARTREQREQRERQERAQQEERERLERLDREQEARRELPHIPVGDTITEPRQLRIGDIFSNQYLRDNNQHRVVVTIQPNGVVVSRVMDAQGHQTEAPSDLNKTLFEQRGPYKREIGPGHVITSPTDVASGSYVTKGDKTYRVVHRTPTAMHIQDVHEGRGVGRPTKVRKADLDGNYKIAVTPRQAQTGDRVNTFSDVRQGQVVRAMHHRTPKWVRVESIGSDSMKLQPISATTGENEGDSEELSKADIKQWAYLTKGNLPEALLPALVAPPGGFAEPGSGELTTNQQAARYDEVSFTLHGASEETLRDLLGPKAAGRDPKHVIADLVGAGGLANSVTHVSISVEGYSGNQELTVRTRGTHIETMSRVVKFEGGKPSSIYNSIFKLEPSAPKQMGLKAFATQVAAAREMGFKYLSTQPAGNGPWRDGQFNGYYVWPRFGYNKSFPSDQFNRMPDSIKDSIREVHSAGSRGLTYIDVMEAGQEARDWWKDHGRGEDNMKFYLSEGSRNLSYLTKYVQGVAKKKADVGVDQFLNRAAAKNEDKSKGKSKDKSKGVEQPPTFGPEEEEISNRIWDAMGAETRKKNKKKKHKKEAARNLVDLATGNDEFRKLLLTELNKGAS